jgi:hypothetical protein
MSEDLEYSLVSAARAGKLERLKNCVAAGANVDTRLANGDSALHAALNWNHIEAIEFLLSKGANPDLVDQKGRTLLMRVADTGPPELVTSLLAYGASPNLTDPEYGLTPLMRAAVRGRVDTVQLLLKAGADPTALDRGGKTALEKAQAWGKTEVVDVLKNTIAPEPESERVILEESSCPEVGTTDPACPSPEETGNMNSEESDPPDSQGKRLKKKKKKKRKKIQQTTLKPPTWSPPAGYRDKLRKEAQKAVSILTGFPDLDSIFLPEAEGKEIRDILRTTKKDIQQTMQRVVEEAEWDRINVGFYGQTNSGKSTVIEALIGGDGTGIGEGYKDFTKHVKDVKYGNLVLLDMPGIEGKEADVREEIAKALRKTHLVFFINGTNKEPDQPVLKKIADDLASEARIYSIINARGKPSAYRDVNGLLNENLQKLEARIIGQLGKPFGKRYQGNFTVQAYLAFLARGNPTRTDLVKDQGKLIQVFSSPSSAFEFSRMATVRQTIDDLAKDGLKEIAVSNTLKLLEPLEKNLNRLYRKREELQKIVDNLASEVSKVASSCLEIFEKSNQKIDSMVNQRIEDMKTEMTKKVYQGIDEGWSESRIKQDIDRIKDLTHAEISAQLNQRILEMKNDLDAVLQAFKRRLELEFKFLDFSEDLPINEILKRLERDFDYYLREAWDLLKRLFWGAIPALLGNVLIAVAAALVVIIRKIWDVFFRDPEKRKREAKQDAYSKIQDAVNNLRRKVQNTMNSQKEKLQGAITDSITKIKEIPQHLTKFLASFGFSIAELARVVAEISEALLRHLSIRSFDKAYVGVKAKEIYIIGNVTASPDGVLARVSDVVVYPSIQELFKSCPHQIENGTLFLDGGKDLAFWALTAFASDLGFESVRRYS